MSRPDWKISRHVVPEPRLAPNSRRPASKHQARSSALPAPIEGHAAFLRFFPQRTARFHTFPRDPGPSGGSIGISLDTTDMGVGDMNH